MCGGPRRGGAQAPIELDHVGVGVAHVDPVLRTTVGRLGATVIYGGYAPGCRYVTARVGDSATGMDLELLEHDGGEEHAFLPRFLERSGPGPHHITFIVRDLDGMLARLAEDGLAPAVARVDDPVWREVFFRPRDMGGIVVQLGETTGGMPSDAGFAQARADEWRGPGTTPRRGWLPGEQGWWSWPGWRGPQFAYLIRVVLPTPDLGRALHVYGDLLGGHVEAFDETTLDLTWPRGGRLRFEQAPGPIRLELVDLPVDMTEIGGATLSAAA